ncbi:MAG: glycosyltransferase [Verrucomicrobia bacterium]|nr:glycosyltransferase [Verrucomicrobiota bacterium]
MRVSVVICTLNRSQALKACLRALESQTDVEPGDVEIVIVDNGSTDNTPTVANDFRRDSRFDVRWHVEDRLGLSNARNRGVAEARGEILVFLDDDAVAVPGWLSAHLRAFDETDADCVGGRITLDWEAPRPHWLHPALDPFFGLLDLGAERVVLAYPHAYPVGANVAYRRKVFERIGLFDPELGVRPGRVVGSEETDICYRVERAGGVILYEPRATVTHSVPAAKCDKRWFRRRAYHAGRTACLIELRHVGRTRLFCRNVQRLLSRVPGASATPPSGKPPSWDATLFLARFRLLFMLGYLAQFLRGR